MKKIAVLGPGFLPIPSVRNGGVEQLTTQLIMANEKEETFYFDVFTVYDKQLSSFVLSRTTLKCINVNILEKIIQKVINKIYYLFKIHKMFDFYSIKAVKMLRNTPNDYDYILIENNMYLYKYINENLHKKSKMIFHLHNDVGDIYKPYELCNYISKTAFRVITCSEFLKKRFDTVVKSQKAVVLNNSIDLNRFHFDENLRNKLRKEYNISNNSIVFSYIGRIVKPKGFLECLKAFVELAKNNKNIYLFVIGSNGFGKNIKDKYYKDINKISNMYHDQIIYTGEIKNSLINSFISAADIVVVPTLIEEAFGLVAIEAMACKRPLLVTDSGELPNLVNALNGIVINRKNIVLNLRNGMEYYINNKNKILEYGNNGYNYVISNKDYNIDNYYHNFIKLISNEEGEY